MSAEAAPAHQFEDLQQQREASTLGMWAFLATEILFFGGVLLAFAVYRLSYPEAFSAAAGHLKTWLGAVNTAVLLVSSLTVALAVHAAAAGLPRRTIGGFILATMVLGAAFLAIKGGEWWMEYREGLVPGLAFRYQGPHLEEVRLFMTLYFVMTGLHALHMLVGLGIFAVLAAQAFRGRFGPLYHDPLEVGGLYWHFVDVVWIFLFPILYLLRT